MSVLTESLFERGVARRGVNHSRRADVADAYKAIDTLKQRRKFALTVQEYEALTKQIHNLQSGVIALMDNQTELF